MSYREWLKMRYAIAGDSASASSIFDLSKHDEARHHGHFDPETMTCKLREAIEDYEGVDASLDPSPDVMRAKKEYADVVAEYEGSPLWMKAPNGKPTHLTERQWVQVRTPSFKKWFGDWEADPESASKIID